MGLYKYLLLGIFCIHSLVILGQEPKLMVPVGHQTTITFAAYSRDGKYIVSTSWDKTVKIWDAGDGKLLREIRLDKICNDALEYNSSDFILNKKLLFKFQRKTGE